MLLLIFLEALLGYVLYDGLISGKVVLKYKTYSRTKNPMMFWISIGLTGALFSFFAILLLIEALKPVGLP
jgi:hypothetical protein